MNQQSIYEYRFRGVDQATRSQVWTEIARFLFDRAGRPARVLDPAAGRGEFISQVPASERWAVDTVDQGLTELDGVRVQICAIEDAILPSAYFDYILVSNLLEHLPAPGAVSALLGGLRTRLKPGGKVDVLGPNFKYCASDYFDCADHVLAMSHLAVAEHLFGAGFRVTDVIPRFLPFSFRSKLPQSARLTRLYLGAPLTWRLLGQQYLVTGTA